MVSYRNRELIQKFNHITKSRQFKIDTDLEEPIKLSQNVKTARNIENKNKLRDLKTYDKKHFKTMNTSIYNKNHTEIDKTGLIEVESQEQILYSTEYKMNENNEQNLNRR